MSVRRSVALIAVLLLVAPLAAQQFPAVVPSTADRTILDATSLVRETGARSVTELLLSRVPGLLVIPGSGLTGAGAQIRFAGVRTAMGLAAPLILLDGMRIDAAEDATVLGLDGPGPARLDDIDVDDVESIEVIRGPASTAVYGPGAETGVILIHTKRAESHPLRWQTHAEGSVTTPWSRWPTNFGAVDADNANVYMRTGYCDLMLVASGSCAQDFQQSFNPLAAQSPFATPLRRRAGLSVTGGPPWGSVRLSADFDGDGGAYATPRLPVHGNNLGQQNLRGSAIARPDSIIELGVTAAHVHSSLGLPVYRPVYYGLDGPSDAARFSWDSIAAVSNQYPNRQDVDRDQVQLSARLTPLRWLAADVRYGMDHVVSGEGAAYTLPPNPSYQSITSSGRRGIRQGSTNVALSAAARWGRTQLGAVVGMEHLTYRLERDASVQCDTTLCEEELTRTWHHATGWYGQANAAIGSRLSAAAALRHDKIRELPRGVTNPSVAIAWVARASDSGLVGRIQLRAAYGSAGSGPAMESESLLPLTLERTRGFELGALANLLRGRWSSQLTVYNTRSDATSEYLSPYGVVILQPHGLELNNRGVVASLSGPLIERASFGWRAQLSVWGDRNRVRKGPERFGSMPGYPFGGYWAAGVTGFADANGDGIIVPAEVQRSPYGFAGTPYPTQGVMVTSSWRIGTRWHASATLDYRAGQTLFNQRQWWRCSAGAPVCRERYDPATSLAQQAVVVGSFTDALTDYYEDADYLKLREITVMFDVPNRVAASIGAQRALVTLAARNLLTWTGYSGGDPEAGSYAYITDPATAVSTVADRGAVPLPRSWSLGIRLGF